MHQFCRFSSNEIKLVLSLGGKPTPLLLVRSLRDFKTVRSTQRVGSQYAKSLLYRTQTSHFTFERCICFKETQPCQIMCHVFYNPSNHSFVRAF